MVRRVLPSMAKGVPASRSLTRADYQAMIEERLRTRGFQKRERQFALAALDIILDNLISDTPIFIGDAKAAYLSGTSRIDNASLEIGIRLLADIKAVKMVGQRAMIVNADGRFIDASGDEKE
ncbi:MAG: hypothetical protein AAGE05_05535 [Pseudomonadota bacterium]